MLYRREDYKISQSINPLQLVILQGMTPLEVADNDRQQTRRRGVNLEVRQATLIIYIIQLYLPSLFIFRGKTYCICSGFFSRLHDIFVVSKGCRKVLGKSYETVNTL